ncbi:hypothetical protein ACU4GI_02975 [Cupriavidus basilensis]
MYGSQIRSLALAGGVVLLLSACPIPILSGYEGDSRENVPATAPDTLRKGESSREDVLMQLGEPDAVALDESWMEFGSRYSLGGLFLFIPTWGGAGIVGTDRIRYRRLIIEFDQAGIISEVIMESTTCFENAAGVIADQPHGDAGVASKPCLDRLGHDIPEKYHLSDGRAL